MRRRQRRMEIHPALASKLTTAVRELVGAGLTDRDVGLPSSLEKSMRSSA